MNVLKRLTIKNLRLNKKRTIMTILGISLSVALITAVFTMLACFRTSMIHYQIVTDGDAHYSFKNVPAEEMKCFSNNRSIKKWFYTHGIGYAKLKESKNVYKPYAYLLSADREALEGLSLKLTEGRFPQAEDEIVIPHHLKTNGRIDYQVGESLTLDIGQRYDADGNLQTDNTALLEDEKLTSEFRKTYKIVGIMERPIYRLEDYSAAGYTFLTWQEKQENNWQGSYTVYVKYTRKALRSHYRTTANILGVDEDFFEKTEGGHFWDNAWGSPEQLDEGMADAKFDYFNNMTLISLENYSLEDGTLAILSTAALIALLLIILSSVFCIRNSFEISITEKIRQYGMLASVGATRKQIRRNVLYEALILGAIGTPLGLLLGVLASILLTKIADVLLQDALSGITMLFSFSLAAVCGAVLVGALTIYLSAIRAARRAAKISPIAAIRSSEDIRIRSKEIKSPRFIKKIFGMGGAVSYKNMKRNRKKYRTIMASIVICVSVFIGLSSFVQLIFYVVESEYPIQDYNLSISIYVNEKLNKQEYKNLQAALQECCEREETERYSIHQRDVFVLSSPKLTEEAQEKIIFPYDEQEEAGTTPETLDIELLSLGDKEYRSYLKSLGLSYEQASDKAILFNTTMQYMTNPDGKQKKDFIDMFDYQKGDTLHGALWQDKEDKTDAKKIDFTLAAITDKKAMGLQYMLNNYGCLIISDSQMEEIKAQEPDNGRTYQIFIKSSDSDKQQDEIEKLLETNLQDLPSSEFHIRNLDLEMRERQSLLLLVAIFLYGFIIVIALIGITSIFNTITASMNLRSTEFAMLRSVGMTKKEFNRMIGLESIFYGTKSLAAAIPLGIAFSIIIYRSLMNELLDIPYTFPLGALLIAVLAVFLLLVCIMRYSLHRIHQQEIIETIRKDMV